MMSNNVTGQVISHVHVALHSCADATFTTHALTLYVLFHRSHVTLTLPRLIALHPRVDQQLAGTNSWEEYLALLLGLAQVRGG